MTLQKVKWCLCVYRGKGRQWHSIGRNWGQNLGKDGLLLSHHPFCTHPSCPKRPSAYWTHHNQPFSCKGQPISSVKGETCSRKPVWKSLEKRGCLKGASGSQDAWECWLRLQPAVSEKDSPSLDSGFPCLLGDAQYMRRCKSGQSEDFIYII